MLDISVIILTFNEEIHIKRCIENSKLFAKNIFVVDSYSTDNTISIAESLGAYVVKNAWENNHSKQFNWGLDNLPIKTNWIVRLDADEYLTQDLIDELYEKFPLLNDNVTGISIPLKRVFLGKEIKRGTGVVTQTRIFKYGKARCESRLMDEHIELLDGELAFFTGAWVDDNLNSISWWTNKHVGYALKEAVELIAIEITNKNLISNKKGILAPNNARKRFRKNQYSQMPLFWRAFIYFIIRYFLKGGFLEGKEGFLWHFLQGWWYRTLVDAKIIEIKRICGNNKLKIIEYIKNTYDIDCTVQKNNDFT